MVFDPFSQVIDPQATPAPTIVYLPAEGTTTTSTILGIDEKYVVGAIIGIIILFGIQELS